MSGFADQLRSFSRSTGVKLDKVVRKVVIDMTSEIVAMTPVDTGHARSNYFWGNQRVSEADPTSSTNGASSIYRAYEFSRSVKAGGVCYITNNLPYIMKLEYGSSKQAPAGMARITVARWQQLVNASVGAL